MSIMAKAPRARNKGLHSSQFCDGPAGIDGIVKFDIEAMTWIQSRLHLDDFGQLTTLVAQAAASEQPDDVQRLLLAIFVYNDDGAAP